MISKPETFGLVYIEALSQGLPIIYTKGEGVDGYFENGAPFAYPVDDPQNINEVAQKIIDASLQLNTELKKTCVEQAQRFDWKNIAEIYKDIYSSILT
jgi:glycosyltransferase involved in cell wall biosynthesis